MWQEQGLLAQGPGLHWTGVGAQSVHREVSVPVSFCVCHHWCARRHLMAMPVHPPAVCSEWVPASRGGRGKGC